MWHLLALLDRRFQACLPGRPNVYDSAAEATGRFIAHTGRAAGRPAEQGAVGLVGVTPRSAGPLARRCGSRRGAPTWARGDGMAGAIRVMGRARRADAASSSMQEGYPRDVTRRRPIGGRPGEPRAASGAVESGARRAAACPLDRALLPVRRPAADAWGAPAMVPATGHEVGYRAGDRDGSRRAPPGDRHGAQPSPQDGYPN